MNIVRKLYRILWPGPVLFFLLAAPLLSGGSRFLRDPGTFWHTVVGERLWQEGFTRDDVFTFTFAGETWIPQQWLGEIFMAKLYTISGFDSQLVVSVALMAGLFTFLGCALLRTGLHVVPAVSIILIALAASATHFHVRPHLMTILGMAVTVRTLIRIERGDSSLLSLAGLIPVYIIWTNTHGGVLGGLTSLGITGAGWTIAKLLKRPQPLAEWYHWRLLVFLGSLFALTMVITPYGADLPRAWFAITGMERLPEIIQEHSPTDWSDKKSWPLIALLCIYGFIMFGTDRSQWRVTHFLPIFWFVQSAFRVRHGPLFCVSALWVIIDLWPHSSWATWLRQHRPDLHHENLAPRRTVWEQRLAWLMVLVMVVVILTLQGWGWRFPWAGHQAAQLDPQRWPVELYDTVKKYEPRGSVPAKVFNDYIDGAYFIRFAPNYRVFIDDRCELFGQEWLLYFVDASRSEEGVDRAMEKWQAGYGAFDFALVRRGTYFQAYFEREQSQWRKLDECSLACFYQRYSSPSDKR